MGSDDLELKVKPREDVSFLQLKKWNNLKNLSLPKTITSILGNSVEIGRKKVA